VSTIKKRWKTIPEDKIVQISELIMDKTLYPRLKEQWQTAYIYAQAMKVGDIFPPIMVGKYQNKLYVVDGWHRIRAKQLLKEKHIQAIIEKYDKFEDMFLDAIKYNISHGQRLSTQEKVRLVHKLGEMKFELEQISKIVKIPAEKIELFKQRVIIGPNGQPTYLKSVVARANPDDKSALAIDQDFLSTRQTTDLLHQLIELIKSGVIDLDDENVKVLAVQLYGLLQDRWELTVEAV